MLKLLFIEFWIGLSTIKAVYDPSKLIPMADYPKDFRVLSCWDCFSANGKMCSFDENKSMYHLTRSSNYGHGICCKPDSTIK